MDTRSTAVLTVARVLLVAAGAVCVVIQARQAGDVVRTRGPLGGAAHTAFGLELAWTNLPLLAVLATLAVAVSGYGRALASPTGTGPSSVPGRPQQRGHDRPS